MIQLILGLVLGYVVGALINKVESAPVPKEELSVEKSMTICEELIYGEPYINERQIRALKVLIEYCKEHQSKEDDLK